MNNKNSFVQKAALVYLTVAISACDPFDPATSPELTARWSADTLALRDGDAVSMWPDSSPNRHDAMATASSRPTYKVVDGVPMVHFDGFDDYMTTGSATDWRFLKDGSDWTVFVVFRSTAAEPNGKYVLLDSDGEDLGFAVSYEDHPAAYHGEAVRLSVADGAGRSGLDLTTGNRGFPPGKWGIISASFKAEHDGYPGEAALFVNGYRRVVVAPPERPDRSRAVTNLNIGGAQGRGNVFPTEGDIREIVIYRRALTQEEHYQAIRYLSGKVSPAVRIRTPLSRRWLGYNPDVYQAFGIAFRIPSTGKLVAIQRLGVAHVGGPNGEVRQWESNDRGATWTNRLTYDSEYDDRGVGGGLASKSGSVIIFFSRYDGANWIDMRALRSVDDAQTFSDVDASLPTNGCSIFLPYGPMIELPSGRLLQTFYGEIGATNKVWVSESDDDGLTWTYKADIYIGPKTVNETSLAWVSGADDATSTLVAISRNDRAAGLLQFVSKDGGSTWTNQGLIPGGLTLDVSPWLHRLSDGTLVNAWHERTWFTFRMRIGVAEEVAASPANWGPIQVTYQAVTNVIGDSGYPALLSATGWDDDLIQVMYDSAQRGKASLVIDPISLP